MKFVLAGTIAGRGGIQTHYEWLSRALLEGGHQVKLLSLGARLDSADLKRVGQLKALGDFEVVQPHLTGAGAPLGTVRTGLEIARLLKTWRGDSFLACGTGWNLFLPAILAGQKNRAFHEVMSGIPSSRKDSRWAVRFGFHDVVAQAGPVARNFAQSFGWKGPITVLPAFPEPLEVTGHVPNARQHTVAAGTAKAAFFSRLVPHKGALWLVQQWPRLSRSLGELHIFGSGPEEGPIRTLIESEDWGNRVFCHGPYPTEQAYIELLKTFDLTLLPTTGAEGAPLVLLESMACGEPFVAFGVGGIPDYNNADVEVVSHEPLENFPEAIERITQRLADGEIDQARLQKFYLENYSFEALKQRWLDWVTSAAPQRSDQD
jgi:glycosyltransferase involved in cell wall biosynthesis